MRCPSRFVVFLLAIGISFVGAADVPPRPDYSRGYVWGVYGSYDVYSVKPDGSDLRRLTDNQSYDAECVYSPDGAKILFTSDRDGDLELYTMNPDGGGVTRITHALGYDGGTGLERITTCPEFDAFPMFTPDGRELVWASNRHGSKPRETNIFLADWKD